MLIEVTPLQSISVLLMQYLSWTDEAAVRLFLSFWGSDI